MSGFGFTPLMGGGGSNVVVAGGTSFPTWDSILASTSLSQGDYIVQNTSVYRWVANDGVSGVGYPVLHDVYALASNITRAATLIGTEANSGELFGWSEGGSGATWNYNTGGELDIVIGASGDTGFLSASHSGATTDHYYVSGYMTIGSQGLAQGRIINSADIYDTNMRNASDRIEGGTGVEGTTINDTSARVWFVQWVTPNEWMQGHLNHNGQAVFAEDGTGSSDARSLFQFGKALGSATGTISFSWLSAYVLTP